jgi:hypothetical protein
MVRSLQHISHHIRRESEMARLNTALAIQTGQELSLGLGPTANPFRDLDGLCLRDCGTR